MPNAIKMLRLKQNNFIATGEEENTTTNFLTALKNFDHEHAKSFISKNYINYFNLQELSDFFYLNKDYKALSKIRYEKSPKDCKITSILIKEKNNTISLIHLFMLKELDSFGLWKIYNIEKE